MPKYRITEKSFIDNTLYGPGEPAGDTVEYDGKPGKSWELLEGEKPKRKPKAETPELELEAEAPAEEPNPELA